MSADWDVEAACRTVDQWVQNLLERAEIGEPPVDAFRLAGALGIVVAWDRRQTNRARLVRLPGRSTAGPRSGIFLQPGDRPERLHWAVAHEIGEHIAPEFLTQCEVLGDVADNTARERLANLLAGRLLLPTCWFEPDVAHLDGAIDLLKARYPTASHELIARRMLELSAPLVVTIFDQGRLHFRRANCPASRRLTPLEIECWAQVHRSGVAVERRDEHLRVRGWAIHEPGWKREIVCAEPTLGESS